MCRSFALTKEQRQSIANISEIIARDTDKAEQRLFRPYYEDRVPAGFPSPAESEPDSKLDLNEYLIRHPLATFFVRVAGDSMIGERIYDGDLLIVDRAEDARHNQIVIAIVNGEFCVKRLDIQPGRVILRSANPAYPDIELAPEDQWEIWGRVIQSIHKH
jgi:DNA polymerase V